MLRFVINEIGSKYSRRVLGVKSLYVPVHDENEHLEMRKSEGSYSDYVRYIAIPVYANENTMGVTKVQDEKS